MGKVGRYGRKARAFDQISILVYVLGLLDTIVLVSLFSTWI